MLTGRSHEHVTYSGAGDVPMNGLLRHPEGGETARNKAVVFAHGLAGKPLGGNEFVGPLSDTLHENGVGVLLAEYGGTGESTWFGDQKIGASRRAVGESVVDLKAAVKTAREAGYDDITLVGFSLGATIMTACAVDPAFVRENNVSGLVLLSPTRMSGWMKAVDDRDKTIYSAAFKALTDGNPRQLVTTDHRGFDMPFDAETYVSLHNSDLVRGIARLTLPIYVAVGSEDRHVIDSYAPDGVTAALGGNTPTRRIVELHGADHGLSGYEQFVADQITTFVIGKQQGQNGKYTLTTYKYPV